MLTLLAASVLAQGFPWTSSQAIDIVKWDSVNQAPTYSKAEQPPLTDDELIGLTQAGVGADALVRMIGERRCVCDGTGAGLSKLKKAGLPDSVLSAVSTHGRRPNRQLNMQMVFDFVGESRESKEGQLFVFVDDGPTTRVLNARLHDLLKQEWANEEVVDPNDPLVGRNVRRITFNGAVPLKTYGRHTALVAVSSNPSITHPSQLSDSERKKAQQYTFEYPRVSMNNNCRLLSSYKRDAVLEYQWRYTGSRFECAWE